MMVKGAQASGLDTNRERRHSAPAAARTEHDTAQKMAETCEDCDSDENARLVRFAGGDITSIAKKNQARPTVPLEHDAWQLARLALGSFAGESWRFRQAFVKIQNDEELADANEHVPPYESYQSTQTYFDFLRNPQRPEEIWTGRVEIILCSPESKVCDVLFVDKMVDHISIFFGPGIKVTVSEAPTHEQEALKKSIVDDGRVVGVSEKKLLSILQMRSRPPGTLVLGLTLHALIPQECSSPVNATVRPKLMVGAFSLYRYVEKMHESRSFVQETAYESIVKGVCAAICRAVGMTSCQLLKCLLNPDTLPYRIQSEEPPMHLCCICMRKLHFATQVDLLDRYALLQTMDFPEAMLATKRIASIGMPSYVCVKSTNSTRLPEVRM